MAQHGYYNPYDPQDPQMQIPNTQPQVTTAPTAQPLPEWGGFTPENYFQYGSGEGLRDAASKYSISGVNQADVRDTLSQQATAYGAPRMSQFRSQLGVGGEGASRDDQGVFNDARFQDYVRTGQMTPQQPQPQQSQQPAMATQLQAQAGADAAQNNPRNTSLWNELWNRASQSTDIDRNDPNIRRQADAYSANEQRSARNYLSDVAERSGSNANLRGEQRMAAERTGQRTGGFEAQLMGRELQAVREQKAQALEGLRGMLSSDEEAQLRRGLAVLDSQLQSQVLGQDWQKALLQNNQFMDNLGLQAEDRASYWDAVRRGVY